MDKLYIFIVACSIQLALWFVKLPRILIWISNKDSRLMTEQRLLHVTDTIERYAAHKKWIFRNCLKRCLLHIYFHHAAHVQGLKLHIGVQKSQGRLDGHSWLTRDGIIYLDTQEKVAQYTEIYSRRM